MAIYHFTVAVISRARGQRIVATAAAQAAAKLRDEYYGLSHDHRRRDGVEFTEIAAPGAAPSWVFEREQLWNRVEAAERRKDAQLARAVEISLPVELDLARCIGLVRDYVHTEFVSMGMIADMSIRRSKLGHPNAHILLTLREATAVGFGPKIRQWNRKSNLMEWRSSWADCANLHLARAGIAVRIDHRSLDAQQIELTPARRTGMGLGLSNMEALPEHLRARFAAQRRIAHDNGVAIVEDPTIAIRALARQRRRFTYADISRFVTSRTDDRAQLDAALATIMASPELVALDDEGGAMLYTSRDLLEAEKSLLRRAQNMTQRGDFQAVAVAPAEMHDFLQTARSHWNERGRQVRDTMPAPGDTLAKHEVMLLQGVEMMELKALEKLLDAAERARTTLVLVADAERLQALGAMSPMHELVARPLGDA